MKILWFTNTPCGATEKLTGEKVTGGGWLFALSQALKGREEIELHIAFYWESEMDSFLHDGIHYHPILRGGIGSKVGRYIYRLKQQFDDSLDRVEAARCLNVYNSVHPDIVHFHGSEENFGLIATQINSNKCVLSIQGLLAPIYYKLYSGIQRDSVMKFDKTFSKMLLDGYAAKDRSMRRRSKSELIRIKSIPNVLGRTDWDRDCTLAINPTRRYFVCNEILRPEFYTTQFAPNHLNNRLVLTTIVSYGLYKGLEMVYETAQLLFDAGINFEWNVIGADSNSAYERLTRIVTGINPETLHIKLLGRKNAEQMIAILCNSHCFIQVSHIENSPNSLCEAMILGMPIIASYAGGTSSLLADGKEGILVQDGDPYRLAGAIINMYNNYNEAVKMGLAARNRAIVRHSPDNVVSELLNAYKMIFYS